MGKQKIHCDVHSCSYCDCEKDECDLKKISVANCGLEDSKECTMCASYEKKDPE